jgi:hypothetical protein
MVCKKVTKKDSICKMKVGKKYRVTHTRKGRHGELFIHESKGGLTKTEAFTYESKLIKEILGRKIKRRRTPYP